MPIRQISFGDGDEVWTICTWLCEPMKIYVIGYWWIWCEYCVLGDLLNGEFVWMRCFELGDFFDYDDFLVYILEMMTMFIWNN